MSIIPLLLGWLLDLIFGDPERLPHPIVWMGRWIAMGEHILNRGVHRMVKGAVFTVM
ncbi:MAG: cobalamin biosynthesis protein, partial [Bacteroidaceae bacterium]|nr:cobalamin biosynthesis protein [Bacteroidaceae bacterium]